jgi:hypothetical protein
VACVGGVVGGKRQRYRAGTSNIETEDKDLVPIVVAPGTFVHETLSHAFL